MENELKGILRELEMNNIEIAVYLAALEIGSGVASIIARRAELNRVTAYEALKRLSKRGFIKIRAKKNSPVRYFVPEDIVVIKEKLERKREKLSETIEQVEALKPRFRSLFTLREEKPTVLFYDGEEGIKTVLMDTLKEKPREIVSFASAESLESGFDDEFLQGYWNKRVSLGIPSRGVMPDTSKARATFTNEKNQKELRGVCFVSPDVYAFKNEIDIYGDSVGITSHEKGNMHGIIIRSRSIAESMKAVFETLWDMSKKQ